MVGNVGCANAKRRLNISPVCKQYCDPKNDGALLQFVSNTICSHPFKNIRGHLE